MAVIPHSDLTIGYTTGVPTPTIMSMTIFLKHDGSGMNDDHVFDVDDGKLKIKINGTGFTMQMLIAGSPVGDFGQKLIPNQWMFAGYSMNGTSDHAGYLKPIKQRGGFTENQIVKSTSASGTPATWVLLNSISGGSHFWQGVAAHLKIWSGYALTRHEMELESQQLAPATSRGIHSWITFTNGVRDRRANHDLENFASISFDAEEPPLPLMTPPLLSNPLFLGKGSAVVRKWLLGAH